MIHKVKCPYCEVENDIYINQLLWRPKQIITCNDEAGGYGKDFVLEIEEEITLKTFKIEGQEV